MQHRNDSIDACVCSCSIAGGSVLISLRAESLEAPPIRRLANASGAAVAAMIAARRDAVSFISASCLLRLESLQV